MLRAGFEGGGCPYIINLAVFRFSSALFLSEDFEKREILRYAHAR
jgi:hypothetical protein